MFPPPRPGVRIHKESERKARIFSPFSRLCLFHYHRHPAPELSGLDSCFSFLLGRWGREQDSVAGKLYGV